MDFFQICVREIEKGPRKGQSEIFPDFIVGRSKDLMVRSRSFYAIWDEEAGLWSTDEYDVQRLIDTELREYAEKNGIQHVQYMRNFRSNGWNQFRKFVSQISDNSHQLDNSLTFSNSSSTKSDYVSRRLPYSLQSGDISAWQELTSVLYSPEELQKIEWAIGAVVSGDSTRIQKFLVLYGRAGTGKSTILDIIQKMFEGYTTTFEAKALGSANGSFATEVFRGNPLVAIQHDGDLSKIEDNTRLNSIISHEEMTMNEKYKPSYTSRISAFLFMGTNQPVKISDAKSGIIRRLIDVNPTGDTVPPKHYHALLSRIQFELGAIAQHCLDRYREMGKNYYNGYRPLEMMFQTDVFFNYIESYYDVFKEQDGVSLKQAYSLYKQFCDETGIDRPLPQYKVRSELQNYFDEFHDRTTVGGEMVRSYYSGFSAKSFKAPVNNDIKAFSLVLDETVSLLDLELADCAAQYAKEDGTPKQRWIEVKTRLADLDSSELHYVQPPENHIVIDFDLKDDDGDKSLERNLEAASDWPATYAELSKSGSGVHLHYHYDGDPGELHPVYSEGIEVKVFSGNSSLRRRLSRCNNVPVGLISSGLPLKEKKVLAAQTVQSEKGLRDLIGRNLRKEIHPGTKPSIDFIKQILDEYYLSGKQYDVSDLKGTLVAFANESTNQPLVCLKTVRMMKFRSDDSTDPVPASPEQPKVEVKDDRLVFFDIEVYPNLFVVCWKFAGSPEVVKMINPTAQDIEKLFQFKLVGFNVRRYDNHILWGRYMGFNLEQLYRLSQKIISGSIGALFGEAYKLSYADIYDFSSVKQGLKKFQIQLGLKHKEMDIPWNQPVPEDRIPDVVEYCANDVVTSEEVFESRKGDWNARLILAELSGLTPNDTTQKHTAKIIFGDDKGYRQEFIYTKLDKEFPGYAYDRGQSTYRGESVGEGGYVYAEPGIYHDVALLDVASMHPTSIEQLNLFGDYTARYSELKEARLAIKAKEYERAGLLLDGRLAPYLGSPEDSKALSDALKIVINIVYGLTSAKFDNPFRDTRNVDNIVAKRGALFMIDLKHHLQNMGVKVVHIKTDSVKIPGATPEVIAEVVEFGKKYGYSFEHEATYEKFCLVNDAVYVAKDGDKWTAVGAQFQHPVVYKTLFGSEKDVVFDDYCETKQVSKGSMYIDYNSTKPMAFADIPSGTMQFVGRTGRFVPVKEGFGGGILYRVQEEKNYAVAGTKGYLWHEADMAATLGPDAIDMSYYENLVESARETIAKFGDLESLLS